ncbi:TetR/AcrR family transcriptional regulator C-terminal domain-containing protein [Microbispora siamensis]|uniref:Tetracycline repressor TetR C-terminal domain-containing protein n=1 Tax=Microbispora siamensis TaxID=564413 RepID=A0ABQ4GGB1_9ACTN|nr:TetR/AcrR family transcriptional regulator C-terminal domain-containing protein [Microbispora siamensis]GIH60463.1 hypothetical protein Msi02_12800 [Microbispora siamensis]
MLRPPSHPASQPARIRPAGVVTVTPSSPASNPVRGHPRRISRALMLRRPWFPAAAAARPGLGPGSLRWLEAWLRAVDGLGLGPDAMLAAVSTIQIFVHGSVAYEVAQRAAGYDAKTWLAAQGAYGDSIIASGAHPTLIRIMVEAEGPHRADQNERLFAYGLRQVLDGLAAALPEA